MTLADMLSRFGYGGAAAGPSGSNIMDYAGRDLSGFSLNGEAPVISGAQMPTGLLSGTPGMRPDMMSWDGLLGYVDPKTGQKVSGWGGTAISLGQALGGMWNAKQQNDLAKDTLKTNKAQFAQNYAAQRQSINTQMQDRQAARVASNPGAYQSVGDYMNENRIR